jgi:hypothetical protein
MLTGIGFVAFVTAAIAERFVNRKVHEALDDAGEGEAELLREVRDIRGRLEGVEGHLQRLVGRGEAQMRDRDRPAQSAGHRTGSKLDGGD